MFLRVTAFEKLVLKNLTFHGRKCNIFDLFAFTVKKIYDRHRGLVILDVVKTTLCFSGGLKCIMVERKMVFWQCILLHHEDEYSLCQFQLRRCSFHLQKLQFAYN